MKSIYALKRFSRYLLIFIFVFVFMPTLLTNPQAMRWPTLFLIFALIFYVLCRRLKHSSYFD